VQLEEQQRSRAAEAAAAEALRQQLAALQAQLVSGGEHIVDKAARQELELQRTQAELEARKVCDPKRKRWEGGDRQTTMLTVSLATGGPYADRI
jgi:hypothetical protein